ncbi:uncharacterized protein LOC130957454 [Arachis stenosperma]|uniref:uncharacterized protein LOC130957454 n=1 Tax=Arachis stenosperma TaxID=217475 RepID=UPI0025AD1051|nr:uncharacterized protein LOC130957454 [Arachis stenosperma]
METSKQSLSDLATIVSDLSKTTNSFITETRSSIRNLEVQIGQLSKRIPKIPSNTLTNNTEVNPKEECKTLTIEAVAESEEELLALNASKGIAGRSTPKEEQILKFEEYSYSDEAVKTREEQIFWYLETLMKLHGKFCETEALEEESPVFTQECSVLVQKKLPQKRPDLESFLIPCTIGTITFEKALCNIGSSINLMPLSVMRRLGILEVQDANISLEMVDKTLKRAYGMVEDVLVKVENLYIPADFIILDTREGKDESIILGRPFLATAKSTIDVEKGELVL